MTFVIQRDRKFEPGSEMTHPHRPTKGAQLVDQVLKVASFAVLKSYDALFASPLSNTRAHDPYHRFVDTTLNRRGKLFTEDNLITYVQFLKTRYPKTSLLFITDGLGKNREIRGVDPLFVIGKKEKREICQVEDGDWTLLKDSKQVQPENSEKRLIAYPFVYPPSNKWSPPHIVLILVDKEEKTIWYYDSQGLTSDDPSRLRIFEDDLDFNMHENLVQLSQVLFPNEVVKLVENLSVHQTDPVNCGAFICWVLEKLYKGNSIEEALMFNPLTASPLNFKKEAGHSFITYGTGCPDQSQELDRAAQ